MKNTISYRIADFLKRYPPFSNLLKAQLESLSEEVSIVYKEKNHTVFTIDESAHHQFYVVHKGAVALWNKDEKAVLDICDEGDIFGLRPLMANENYRLTAKTEEETILYAIPIENFRPFIKENRRVADFLVESFASNTRNPYDKSNRGQLLGESSQSTVSSNNQLLDLQPVDFSKSIESTTEGTTIQVIAEKMTAKGIGAMLIEKNGLPIGIITDKDLRNKIATGEYPITAKAQSIMSSPIITYPTKLTVTQAQMAMMKSNISHLVLTEDGTVNTKAVGILSKHDLMLSLGNNPAVLVKAIKRAKSVAAIKPHRTGVMNLLRGYLDQNIPMALTSKIIAELNDVCIKKVVELSLEKMDTSPPVKFAWLAMGSQGRSEQLLHTDQDNALLFADIPDTEYEETKNYFLHLAKLITNGLNTIGYEYCPADMMGSNPKWCNSLSGFKEMTSKWIASPGPDEVLLSNIFFDYNRAYGDKELVSNLSKYIFDAVEKHPIFLSHLAGSALMNPSPSGFFRQFLVEQDGEHKDFFDLKQRALMPLVDAARVLILSKNVPDISNTWERYEKLAELEPNNKELFLACSYATKALLRFRTKQGLQNNDSGRYINLEQLNKEEKMKLKRTFKTIKEIQEVINIRFMVSRVR
jgi:CBS domain-containing protein